MITMDGLDTKADAEADALDRVKRDASLAKIAYYKISPSGDFKLFYTYTNPKVGKVAPVKRGLGDASRQPNAAKKPATPVGLWDKIKRRFGIGA